MTVPSDLPANGRRKFDYSADLLHKTRGPRHPYEVTEGAPVVFQVLANLAQTERKTAVSLFDLTYSLLSRSSQSTSVPNRCNTRSSLNISG